MLLTSERAAREESVMQGQSAMLTDSSHLSPCSLLKVRPLQQEQSQYRFPSMLVEAICRKLSYESGREGCRACLIKGQRSSFRWRRLTVEDSAAMPLSSNSGRQPRSRLMRVAFCDNVTMPANHDLHLVSALTHAAAEQHRDWNLHGLEQKSSNLMRPACGCDGRAACQRQLPELHVLLQQGHIPVLHPLALAEVQLG